MEEGEFPGMEEEAGCGEGMSFPVDGISEDGGAEVMEVDADLMGAPGVEVAAEEGGAGCLIGGEDFVIGDGGFPGRGGDDGHFLAVHGMAADVGEDGIAGLEGDAIGDGEVDFLHGGAGGELGDEGLVGGIGFCDDEAAGGVFIKAVDDAGTLHAADA